MTEEEHMRKMVAFAKRKNAEPFTDTDRLNALFTLFGGHFAFSPFTDIAAVMRNGRRGIDALIADNPSLLGDK